MNITYTAVPLLVYVPQGHPFADRGNEYIEGSLTDHLRLIGLTPLVAEDYDNATVSLGEDDQLSADIHKVCPFVDGTTTPSLRRPPLSMITGPDPYATLKTATPLLHDLDADYEFPGYISITRFGITFAFGTDFYPLLEGGKQVFCYNYGPAIDPGAMQEGGLSTIAATVPPQELANWIRLEVACHEPAAAPSAHEIFHRPIGEPEEAKRLFRYLHQHGMLFHPDDHPLDCLDGRILPADALALKHRMNEARSFDGFDPYGFVLELEGNYPTPPNPQATHSPAPWTQDPEGDISISIEDANGIVICDVHLRDTASRDPDTSIPHAQANIKLITASPKLLAACERVLRSIEWSTTEDRMTPEEQAETLRSAITQATT